MTKPTRMEREERASLPFSNEPPACFLFAVSSHQSVITVSVSAWLPLAGGSTNWSIADGPSCTVAACWLAVAPSLLICFFQLTQCTNRKCRALLVVYDDNNKPSVVSNYSQRMYKNITCK
jgi:hypothetical protein